jgi:hypothetical protein
MPVFFTLLELLLLVSMARVVENEARNGCRLKSL